MKIAITGIAGFIGSNLAVRLLQEGHEVVGIDNLSFGVLEQIPAGVEFHKSDVRNPDLARLFRGVDAVFHLAAKNCISDCQSDPVATADINVCGTVNVFDAAVKASLPKVIYAESSSVYEGDYDASHARHEVQPHSFYAVSKYATALFAGAFQRQHGLRATALRYFNVYGPRQDYRRTVPPVTSSFIIQLLQGKSPVIYGSGRKRRDFIYVDDVNDFHVLALHDRRTDGHTYNLGSGTNSSIIDLYDEIEGLLRTGIRPAFKNDLPGQAESNLADISAARALGWTPKVSLREGLRRSIEYIKTHVLATRSPSRTKSAITL